ncbi:MAG: MinD/ParA family protein [Planctomycetaceae bacterium]
MSDQANVLRDLMVDRLSVIDGSPESHGPADTTTARMIAVTSGKGGVGKSIIALNLAVKLSRMGGRVCLLDANLGLGNIDLLCGLNGYWNFSHVITGARALKDIVIHGPENVDVIPGASSISDVANCNPTVQRDIVTQLQTYLHKYDYFVMDTATGLHRTTRRLLSASDMVLIVTTPEPTAIAEAYATVKSLIPFEQPLIEAVVNQSQSAAQGQTIIKRLQQTAAAFVRTEIGAAGIIPHDPHVAHGVVERVPFVTTHPDCPAADAIGRLAQRMQHIAQHHIPHLPFFTRLKQNVLTAD